MKRFLTAALIMSLGSSIITNAADIKIYTDKEIHVEQSESEKLIEETTETETNQIFETVSETEELIEETTEIETNQIFETVSETENLIEETTETISETENLTEETTEANNKEENSHKTDINISNNNVISINGNNGNIYITIINGVAVAVNDNGDIITDIDISNLNSINILNEETSSKATESITETSKGKYSSSHSSGKSRDSRSSSKSTKSNNKVTEPDNEISSIKTKSNKKTAVLSIGSNKINIDGTVKTFDSAPYISDSSYTLLPLRAIASLFDNTQVIWDCNTKSVIIISEGNIAFLKINSDTMLYNEKKLMIQQPPVLKNSRTYVGIREISELLGASVEWDSSTKSITITK